MMISFVGAPCSGKTTTAAFSFATLKEYDIAAEFIPEFARWHIARKKESPNDIVTLNDYDQLDIMYGQIFNEKVMRKSCGDDVVLVCDSSALNSLVYMSPAGRDFDEVKELTEKALSHYDVVFYCPRVKPPRAIDPNRVHSNEEAAKLEEVFQQTILECCPGLEMVTLYGDMRNRPAHVVSTVLGML